MSDKETDEKKDPVVETGTVKWFNQEKGFGFIERPNGRDLFVHYKEIRGALNQGDEVSYQIGEAKKGPCAAHVKVLKRNSESETQI